MAMMNIGNKVARGADLLWSEWLTAISVGVHDASMANMPDLSSMPDNSLPEIANGGDRQPQGLWCGVLRESSRDGHLRSESRAESDRAHNLSAGALRQRRGLRRATGVLGRLLEFQSSAVSFRHQKQVHPVKTYFAS